MRPIAVAAAAGAIAVAVAAAAQPTEVTLKLRREPGQTLKYRAIVSGAGAVTMLGEDNAVSIRGRFVRSERTLSEVRPGVWEVLIAVEQPSLVFRAGDERQTLAMQSPPMTEVITDRGQVLEMRGGEPESGVVNAPGVGEAVRPLFELMQEEGLPDRPLKPGDKWVAKARLKLPDGSNMEVAQQFELLGFEEVAGAACAKIRSVADIPLHRKLPPDPIGMQVSMEGAQHIETTSLLAYDEGVLVRQENAITLDLKTTTLLDPNAPERTIPGAISLRVSVILDLER